MAKLTKEQLARRKALHADALKAIEQGNKVLADMPFKPAPKDPIEYIVVGDHNSEVLKSGTYAECRSVASLVRRGGGSCTVFKATKG